MPKLLLVEDDKIIANIYQRKFTQEGFNLAHSEDGRGALVQLRSFVPDIVVLDLMLPKLNGIEVLKELRAQEQFADLPVIVFSNACQSKLIEEAWAAGATSVLMKANTNPKTLVDNVNELLAKRAALPPAESSPPESSPTPGAPAPPDDAFHRRFPEFVTSFRSLHQNLLTTTDPAQRQSCLGQLVQACQILSSGGRAANIEPLARVSEAGRILYEEFRGKPATISASSIRTSTQIEDVLQTAAEHLGSLDQLTDDSPVTMVVDDAELSSRTDIYALERAGCKVVSANSGELAVTEARRRRFDLIVISLHLVGMNSEEILRQIRALPGHATTPAVFVTPQPEFQHRIPSEPDANTDVIASPYSLVEMGLKAVIHNLRSKLLPDSPQS